MHRKRVKCEYDLSQLCFPSPAPVSSAAFLGSLARSQLGRTASQSARDIPMRSYGIAYGSSGPALERDAPSPRVAIDMFVASQRRALSQLFLGLLLYLPHPPIY